MKIEFGDGLLTINDNLEQKIWSEKTLKPEISQKLIEIATKFFEDLEMIYFVKFPLAMHHPLLYYLLPHYQFSLGPNTPHDKIVLVLKP